MKVIWLIVGLLGAMVAIDGVLSFAFAVKNHSSGNGTFGINIIVGVLMVTYAKKKLTEKKKDK